MFRILAIVPCFAFILFSQAYATTSQDKKYSEYYTVSEKSAAKSSISMQPLQVLQEFVEQSELVASFKKQILNLLNFEYHKGSFGGTTEAYQRLKHFGTWLRDEATCLNTRASVLIRDSQKQVTYSNGAGCTVATGEWYDPYTDYYYSQAADVQIDHMVPLKNAYVSGASTWNFQRRCLYTNFMGNNFHLLPVDGHENTKKSDKGPEGYLPPNDAYICEYLHNWAAIKLIWNLGLNPDEAEAIQQVAQDHGCQAKSFLYSVADLQKQRKLIQDNLSLCKNP